MATVIQSKDEDTVALPTWLMHTLRIREGDEIRTVINGNTLQLTPLDRFLELRGVWADDGEFEAATQYLERTWQQWTYLESA